MPLPVILAAGGGTPARKDVDSTVESVTKLSTSEEADKEAFHRAMHPLKGSAGDKDRKKALENYWVGMALAKEEALREAERVAQEKREAADAAEKLEANVFVERKVYTSRSPEENMWGEIIALLVVMFFLGLFVALVTNPIDQLIHEAQSSIDTTSPLVQKCVMFTSIPVLVILVFLVLRGLLWGFRKCFPRITACLTQAKSGRGTLVENYSPDGIDHYEHHASDILTIDRYLDDDHLGYAHHGGHHGVELHLVSPAVVKFLIQSRYGKAFTKWTINALKAAAMTKYGPMGVPLRVLDYSVLVAAQAIQFNEARTREHILLDSRSVVEGNVYSLLN
jgi:hypothetical protein